MDLFEFEKAVSLPRTVICFYEELLPPTKKDTRWRDYDESHVIRLKKIIVLRKIGIQMEELTSIFDGTMPLKEALAHRSEYYRNELNPPLGARQLCAALLDADETIDGMDADAYTAAIRDAEESGLEFEDVSRDRMGGSKFTRTFAKLFLFESFDKRETKDLLLTVLGIFAIGLIGGLIDFFKSHESIWVTIFYPIIGLGIFGAFYLLNLFGRKHPKGAMHILSGVLWVMLTALALLFLFIIVLLLDSVFHFWY